MLLLSVEMCCFFAFHAGGFWVGFFWRCVEECDWALRGLGFEGFFVFSLFLFYWVFILLWFVCFGLFVFSLIALVGY
jgi:hypothetical protein